MSTLLLTFQIIMTFMAALFTGGHVVKEESEIINKPEIVVSNFDAAQNGYIDVYLEARNFENIGSLELFVFYEADYFELSYQSTQYLLESSVNETYSLEGEVGLYAISSDGINGNGSLWYLQFHVLEETPLDKYTFTVAVGEVFSTSLNPINIDNKTFIVDVNRKNEIRDTVYFDSYYNNYTNYIGDIVEITYYTYSGNNFASANFNILYDDSVFEFEDFIVGDSLKSCNGSVYSINSDIKGEVILSYASLDGINDAYPLFTLKLEVTKDIDVDTFVSLYVDELYTKDLKPLDYYSYDLGLNIDIKEESKNISISDYDGCSDEFTVNVSVDGGLDLAAGDFVINYDMYAFECLEASKINDDVMIFVNPNYKEGTIRFSFISEDGLKENSEIVSLKFKKNYEVYETYITITGNNLVNSNLEEISANYVSGMISTDHDLVWIPYKEPTCLEHGWWDHYECTRCDYGKDSIYEAYGHSYNEYVTYPTCTSPGFTTYICYRCQDSYVGNITEATGHDYYNIYYSNDLEKEEVTGYAYCGCGHTEIETVSLNKTVTKQPTCTENGEIVYESNEFQSELFTVQVYYEPIYSLGHSLTYYGYKEPTCTEDGHYAYEECTRCDHTTYQMIPAYGHALTYYGYKEPTCTENGHNAYEECTRCNHTTYQVVPSTGHSLTHYDAKEPTCTEDGHNAYEECSKCDYTTYQIIPAHGHTLTYYGYKEPTCTEDGHNAYEECSKCDYTTYQIVPSTGHSLTHYDAKEPTCTENGHYGYEECSKCDYTTYQMIPAHGHALTYYGYKEPTCTENGHYGYEECSKCDHTTYQMIPAHGHTLTYYGFKEPTCTEDGHNAYEECSNCDYTTYQVVASEGHTLNYYEGKDPTCTEDGHNAYEECSKCDYTTYQMIPAHGHTLTYYGYKEPTCTEDGHNAYEECSNCDYTTYQIVPSTGHSLTHYDAKEPTCTEDGHNAYEECSNCDYTTYQIVPSTGHSYDKNIFEPTCVNKGYTQYICSKCSHMYLDDFIDALDHNLVHVDAKEPTTEEHGWYEYDKCTRCDYTTIIIIPALNHEMVSEIVLPTCEEQGYTIHTCVKCNETFVDTYVPALGHDLVEHEGKQPTCEEDGYYAYEECSRCDYHTKVVINSLGHSLYSKVVLPTCEEQGYTVYSCKNCSHSYKDYYVDSLGHNIIKHEAKLPTCEDIGWNAYEECTRCNHTTFVEIPALGHDYESTVTPPTCEEQGYTTHTCSRCNDTYKDSYEEALGHTESEAVKENEIAPTCKTMGSYDEVIYCSTCHEELSRTNVKVNKLEHTEVVDKAVAPTCTTAGLTEGKHCSECNQVIVIQQIVPALGHDYESTVTLPTCEEQGYTTHTCSRCNDIYKDSYEEALGHTESKAVKENEIAPTCKTMGSYDEVIYCSTCHEELSRTNVKVNKLEHTEVVDKAVAPTCTTAGLTEGKHCSICNQVTIIQQIVPALGHDYESTVTPPTCEEQGYTTHTCSRCNDTYKDSYVAKLDHDLLTYQVINPTCEEQGYTIYECVNCNEKIHGNYVLATGHSYGEYINDGDVHYQVCSKCNHESEKEQHILEDNKCIKCDYKNNIVAVIVSIVSGVITGIIGLIFFLIKKRK